MWHVEKSQSADVLIQYQRNKVQKERKKKAKRVLKMIDQQEKNKEKR